MADMAYLATQIAFENFFLANAVSRFIKKKCEAGAHPSTAGYSVDIGLSKQWLEPSW